MRPIEALALEILDADGAVSLEEDAGGERIEDDPQPVGEAPRDFEQALARPGASVVPGGERKIADAGSVLPDQAPVVGIESALERPSGASDMAAVLRDGLESRIEDGFGDGFVGENV
jgi:hypothetical protein